MANNAIIGQSGGPTAVINASLAGALETCRHCGAGTVYGMCNGIQGLLQERVVDLSQLLPTAMDLELLKRTPASYLGSCRYKLPNMDTDPTDYETIFSVLDKLDIGWFFYIGGNDSMDTICKLSDYGRRIGSSVRFVGIPKTIDNDLMITDHTPGYGSAAKYIGTVAKELVRDCAIYDLRAVTVVEIMGRNAGWLTAAAALAQGDDCEGVDMICMPEVPFAMDTFLARIEALQTTKKPLVIAVSEGIKLADGRYVCELADDTVGRDVFGHKNLTGTAQFLSGCIASKLHVKSRAIELSTLQRCASHMASLTDIEEAYRVGGAAVMAAAEGCTGEMVALKRLSNVPYCCETEMHDIHAVANQEKTVPLDWINQNEFGITADFLQYARPLIQSELPPLYINGLPRHIYQK